MNFSKSLCMLIISLPLFFLQCAEQKQFTEMPAEETGLHFRNEIIESEHNNIMTYEYTYNGGGVATGDVNNDGLADVYFSGNSVPNKLYLNKGEWKFDDVTQQSGMAGRSGDWKTGVTMADVNGDGWLDIYVCYSGNAKGEGFNKPVIKDHPKRTNQLFINKGGENGGVPVFEEQAKAYGLDAPGSFSTQAYFFDYDRDGDLDMFLLNHANMFYSVFFNVDRLRNLRHPYFGNRLYRNDDNKFTEVSDEAAIHGSGLNFGLSASISDLNADNWPDIYVTNDYDEQDFCYINNADGTFTEVSHQLFGHLSKYGMGSDIADMNNDGLPDIFVADMLPEDNYRQKLLKGPDEYDKYTMAVDSGYHHQYMRNTLQLNRGMAPDSLPRFSEVGQLAGVSNTDWSWAPLFADLDNDGLKDIFVTNGYLRDYTSLDFTKYTVQNAVNEANAHNHPVDVLTLIQQIPSTKLKKYVFSNTDGLHFTDQTEAWGLTKEAISNAAAYADLDNDGDLDLVVSNLNDEVTVLQNHQEKIQKNNYIKIRLKGSKPNTSGIGAKVWIMAGDKELYHEVYFTRGYQSSVEPVLTVGVGKTPVLEEIKVLWPDGRVSRLKDVPSDQTLVIDQQSASDEIAPGQIASAMHEPLLKDMTGQSGIEFRHVENAYVDFKYQKLLLYQLSRLGGKLAVADVNGDGNDDVYLCGAAGQAGGLYYGKAGGTFMSASPQPWAADATYEDLDALFFDADGDGDRDLYVVSGGTEFVLGSPHYQDRLYVNDGSGGFSKAKLPLPADVSGGCIAAADYDQDGDLDLFIGGRLVPHYYPLTPESLLLRNDTRNGELKFTDVTATVNEQLQKPGMVTDAVWTDFNNDSWPDLILVGEWMPVIFFKNDRGVLKNVTDDLGLAGSHGWWNCVSPADVDHDGDLDFLLGNAGLNLQFRASAKEPVTCYDLDIDNDGQLDPVLCYYVQGTSYPLPGRDELLEQVVPLRKKFVRYADYARATIEDIVEEERLAGARMLKAETLHSSYLENTGDGKFLLKPLPAMAQVSAVNAFIQDDFDGDGTDEILAAGNFFPYRVQMGRSDASEGIMLSFGDGEARVQNAHRPLWLSGDIRDMAIVKFQNGAKRIVVSRNNDAAGVYEYAVRPVF